MANYKTARQITRGREGFYSNDPVDTGGETVWGFARNKWPGWRGWKIVDEYKKKAGNPTNVSAVILALAPVKDLLHDMADEYDKQNFWDVLRADEIKDQVLANKFYDTAVNMGVPTAVKMMEEVLGLKIDGKIDDEVINRLNGTVWKK